MIKRLLPLAGTAISLAAFVFVLRRLPGALNYWSWIRQPGVAAAMLAALLLGLLANGMLALAWDLLLRAVGQVEHTRLFAVKIYARAQIGKYLPGSIFQFIGRQALGKRLGFSHRDLSLSAVIELATVATAAILLAGTRILQSTSRSLALTTVAAMAVAAVVGTLIAHRRGWLRRLELHRIDWKLQSCAACIHLLYFFLGGLGLFLLTQSAGSLNTAWTLPRAVELWATGWLLGFITPGSPGGLGVRDAFLLSQLGPFAGSDSAAAVVVVFRAVTTLADVATWGWSFIGWPSRPSLTEPVNL